MSNLYAEYDAKGWPSIDPRSANYCYRPCFNGIHVCGVHPDGDNCLTVLNLPLEHGAARSLFDAAKAELSEPDKDESDFIVDLCVDGDINEDFRMNRQMLGRLRSMADAMMEARK
ncbi:hypothetical protein OB03_13110 [Brevundimonas sp. GN22]